MGAALHSFCSGQLPAQACTAAVGTLLARLTAGREVLNDTGASQDMDLCGLWRCLPPGVRHLPQVYQCLPHQTGEPRNAAVHFGFCSSEHHSA